MHYILHIFAGVPNKTINKPGCKILLLVVTFDVEGLRQVLEHLPEHVNHPIISFEIVLELIAKVKLDVVLYDLLVVLCDQLCM